MYKSLVYIVITIVFDLILYVLHVAISRPLVSRNTIFIITSEMPIMK